MKTSRRAERRRTRKVIELREAGLSVEEIAQQRRLRKRTIRKILEAAGVGPSSANETYELLNNERALDMSEEQRAQDLARARAWIHEALAQRDAEIARLSQQVEDLKVAMGKTTLENFERRVDDLCLKFPELDYTSAFEFALGELEEQEREVNAKSYARQVELAQSEYEREAAKLDAEALRLASEEEGEDL